MAHGNWCARELMHLPPPSRGRRGSWVHWSSLHLGAHLNSPPARTRHSVGPSQPVLEVVECEVASVSAVVRLVRGMATWLAPYASERHSGYSRSLELAQMHSMLASPPKTLARESVLWGHEVAMGEVGCRAEGQHPENVSPHLAVRQPRIDAAMHETRAGWLRFGDVAA